MKLSKEQEMALKKIDDFSEWYDYKGTPFFVLSGVAGSGKTTLIQFFTKNKSLNVLYMAFTGKAVQVLLSKGYVPARTIHSVIYAPVLDKDGNIIDWRKKRFDEIGIFEDLDLIVIDEVSMLNNQVLIDLLSYKIPIIFIGDKNQLPPVKGKNNLMKNPNFHLKTPLRQKLDSGIIRLSQEILSKNINLDYGNYGDYHIITHEEALELRNNVDQILVGKNVTRKQINMEMKIDKSSYYPSVNEKMICKENDWKKYLLYGDSEIYLTNGLIGEILFYDSFLNIINFKVGGLDVVFSNIRLEKYYFESKWEKVRQNMMKKTGIFFDFAYAITVHSSQGSEYDKVLLYFEPFGRFEDKIKWFYTAVTRAKKELYIVV